MFVKEIKVKNNYLLSKLEIKRISENIYLKQSKERFIDFITLSFSPLICHKISVGHKKSSIIYFKENPILFKYNDLYLPTIYFIEYFPDYLSKRILISPENKNNIIGELEIINLREFRNQELKKGDIVVIDKGCLGNLWGIGIFEENKNKNMIITTIHTKNDYLWNKGCKEMVPQILVATEKVKDNSVSCSKTDELIGDLASKEKILFDDDPKVENVQFVEKNPDNSLKNHEAVIECEKAQINLTQIQENSELLNSFEIISNVSVYSKKNLSSEFEKISVKDCQDMMNPSESFNLDNSIAYSEILSNQTLNDLTPQIQTIKRKNQEAMDQNFIDIFLNCIVHFNEKIILPIFGKKFFKRYMIALAQKLDVQLEILNTSFKNLRQFFHYMSRRSVIKFGKLNVKNDHKNYITKIFADCQLIKNFQPKSIPDIISLNLNEDSDEDDTDDYITLYYPKNLISPIFLKFRGLRFYQMKDAIATINEYIWKNNLKVPGTNEILLDNNLKLIFRSFLNSKFESVRTNHLLEMIMDLFANNRHFYSLKIKEDMLNYVICGLEQIIPLNKIEKNLKSSNLDIKILSLTNKILIKNKFELHNVLKSIEESINENHTITVK